MIRSTKLFLLSCVMTTAVVLGAFAVSGVPDALAGEYESKAN